MPAADRTAAAWLSAGSVARVQLYGWRAQERRTVIARVDKHVSEETTLEDMTYKRRTARAKYHILLQVQIGEVVNASHNDQIEPSVTDPAAHKGGALQHISSTLGSDNHAGETSARGSQAKWRALRSRAE